MWGRLLFIFLLLIFLVLLFFGPRGKQMPVESGALIERVEQQAQEAESQGDLDQAVRSLRALETAAPQDPEINLRLGRILTWKGEYFEAEVMLRRAVEEDPKNGAAWEALGLLYLQTGRFHEAEALFKEHVPGGMPHASLLKEVEAESIRQQVRRGDPYALSRLLYEQAGQAYDAGDAERALSLYLAVHTFHPQLPLVSYRIGRIYASQGEPSKAIPFLQQAFLFQPDNYDALELLSASQLRVGQVEEAYQGFLKVLERYPGSVTATIGLIEAEQKLFGPDAELVIKERGLLYQAMAEALLLEKEKRYLEAAKIWLEL
ncbi:MAG: tetratricopeptide repeat protein, partial [Chlamydiia bacterium]|nr:tetratricopeptide repeat protein [Chlamydiia bacterium]